mmetsp:Transcript_66990/g.185531  ORF Transcript_66990/g.185531 Transcript_66990/m.185531 type:complete len:224 (+) Transcript_66990:1601-2272(+)
MARRPTCVGNMASGTISAAGAAAALAAPTAPPPVREVGAETAMSGGSTSPNGCGGRMVSPTTSRPATSSALSMAGAVSPPAVGGSRAPAGACSWGCWADAALEPGANAVAEAKRSDWPPCLQLPSTADSNLPASMDSAGGPGGLREQTAGVREPRRAGIASAGAGPQLSWPEDAAEGGAEPAASASADAEDLMLCSESPLGGGGGSTSAKVRAGAVWVAWVGC